MRGAIDRAVAALVRHRLVAVLTAVAVAGAMAAFVARLDVDNSLEIWFVEDDPALVSYRRFVELFGNDEVVVTILHGSADAFAPDRLERLWHLGRRIEEIDGVARVRSLADQTTVQGSVIGPAVVPVVTLPVGDDDVERARQLVMRRALASDLVGRDGKTLVLTTWLEATPTVDAERRRIIREIREATERTLAPGERASHGGVGVLHEALNEATLADGTRFVGLSYIVMTIALYLVTRRLAWTLLALVAVTLADVVLFGVMVLSGRSVNMITIALPPLVLILGVASMVHMATDVDLALSRGTRGIRELTRCLAAIARPCLFNAVTTSVACLSLGTATMAVTRDYGVFAAVGVGLAFVFSLLAMAAVMPRASGFRPLAGPGPRIGSAVARLMRASVRHRTAVLVATAVLAGIALFGAARIVVDTNSLEFLPEEHPARTDIAAIEDSAGPFLPLEMTLRTSGAGTWRMADFFGDLAEAQAALESLPQVGRTTTAADVLRDVHVAVTGQEVARPWKPESDEDVENLTELLEWTDHGDVLEDWVAEDGRTLRLTATTRMTSARELADLLERALTVTRQTLGDEVDVQPGGYLPLYSRIVTHTLDDQVTSFTLAFLLVFVVVGLVLGSWRCAVAAIPPNLLPVVLVLGVMGFAGIRLDLATVTVAAVVMGVVVDDSVHILYRLRRELRKNLSFDEAIGNVARAGGVAVVSTSLVFTTGFLVISLAASEAVGIPGLLTAVAVVAALLTDVLVLPAFASLLIGPQRAKTLVRRGGGTVWRGNGRAAHPDRVGGKAVALARLTAAGFPVPEWIVVTARAFDVSVSPAQQAALANGDESARGGKLDELHLAPSVVDDLREALPEVAGGGRTFAVRSSAVDEDSSGNSFAGQLESYLSVRAEDVPRRVTDVWRSAFSARVLAYRRGRGLPVFPSAPGVVVQRMVDADVSGVAFSVDPLTGDRDVVVVASVAGLGTALVSGKVDGDTHHVDRNGRIVMRRSASGPASRRPALKDEQAIAVADLARRTESFFGCPQDIEWAIASGRLFLLQSRPVTSLSGSGIPGGWVAIWDNSNIVESYAGVTTPLTFTFVRNAYRGVYTGLLRRFAVPAGRIEANQRALAGMLGLIRGRIYYNLLNWYRLLTLVPGYRVNRTFLDQMLGVRGKAPDRLPGDEEPASRRERWIDGLRAARSLVSMTVAFVVLPSATKRFLKQVDRALDLRGRDLARLRPDELAHEYRRLEDCLIARWETPQVNDFFAMIFHGVLRRLCRRWCGDPDGTLQNGLLIGSGGMVSTEPAKRIREMAEIAGEQAELASVLRESKPGATLEILMGHDELRRRCEAYLQDFGDRCPDELKLESRTLREDPSMLLRSIGSLALAVGQKRKTADTNEIAAPVRHEAEIRVRASLAGRPLRRWVFGGILGTTRCLVRNRENLRLRRTRVFGRVRALFIELGRRLHDLGLLEDPRDVFYLEMDEVLGFVDGTTVTTDLAGVASVRKRQFARYNEDPLPADRFETRGMVNHGNAFRVETTPEGTGDRRSGVGCCPGRVVGRVHVVRNPSDARLGQGEILVAERTDPGWVMLFPLAGGLLVERGSLLSHSAIVAREMGIPAIVSLPGVTSWLADGDLIELDGAAGTVRKVSAEEEPS